MNSPFQIQVDLNELRKKKLFVATPMYGGFCHGLYTKSCLDLHTMCIQYGIEIRFSSLFNESLIPRARNYLTDEYLRSDNYTHLLFIDADIEFDPKDVLTMLALDLEITGGPYPKKSISWNSVKNAILKNPNIDAGELGSLIGDFVFNPVPGTTKFNIFEPLEVLDLGTGFMMIKREVFEKFKKAYPEKEYRPDHLGQKNFDGSRTIHAYFDCVIDPDTKRYLSEDYFFVQACRKIGIKVWLLPWVLTKHVGTYAFEGNLPKIAQLIGNLGPDVNQLNPVQEKPTLVPLHIADEEIKIIDGL